MSGRRRSPIYRLDRATAAVMAPSLMVMRVVGLVAVPQAEEDGLGRLLIRLPHQHRLEPPLQGGVLLDIFAVLLGRWWRR